MNEPIFYRGFSYEILRTVKKSVYTSRRDPMVPLYRGVIPGARDVYGDTVDEVMKKAEFLIDHEIRKSKARAGWKREMEKVKV